MILLSAHLDRVIQDYDLSFRRGQHRGLLDNFIGVLSTYLVLYDDHNVRRLEQEGRLLIWHGKGEEWGRLDGAPKLGKKDLAIVVDVAAGSQYRGCDFGVENVSGLSLAATRSLREDLEWQGFSVRFARYTGNPIDEDEAWQWRKLGIPTLSFIVPIQAVDDGWHRVQQDNTVDATVVSRAAQGLKRIICHFAG